MCFVLLYIVFVVVFFFNDTATTEIYTYGHTRSLHDALPIYLAGQTSPGWAAMYWAALTLRRSSEATRPMPLSCTSMTLISPSGRSEEHTSELQSLMRISYAVFCLKKKNKKRSCMNSTI